MTDYIHQVAFLRKPLQLAKTQLKDAYVNNRGLSNEPINVLINGKKVRHALYQSPVKACFNTVFNCKMDSRHLLWGSPSECYNRMFAGEISEGASPISVRKKHKLLPCVNPFFTEAEEKKWKEGCRNGRFHPKYWGVDWGFRQWFDNELKKKKEGKIIEYEVRTQMYAEGFDVFSIDARSGTGPDAKPAKSAAVAAVKSPTTITSPSVSTTATSSKPSLPQQSEATNASPTKAQITPEEYVAQALAASRTLGAKERGNHEAQVRAKASRLERDNWLPVPLTHIALQGTPQENSQSQIPELVLIDPYGQPFELVERPDRLWGETEQEAKEREDKQKKLYFEFERWDVYCKRKEEYFWGRGDIYDKDSEMMRLFKIEEANADNARKWWAREQRIRNEKWKPCPEAAANQAMETRYKQLFGRIAKRRRAEKAMEEQTKRSSVGTKNGRLFIEILAELLARRMIVKRRDGTLCAAKNITFSDRIEGILLDRSSCAALRDMASGGDKKYTAQWLKNEELKKAKSALKAGSKRSAPAKRLDW